MQKDKPRAAQAEISDKLTPGKHTVALEMEDGSELPYSLQLRYHASTPASARRGATSARRCGVR